MKETKLTFITDTHHFSKTLSDGGRQYKLRSGSDQKCLMETGAIIDAAFAQIAQSDTDAVMIIGDLTNNGECVSHAEFREKLYALQKKKNVYVITATHDWCSDGNPRRYCGNAVWRDVPTMKSDALRDYYFDFGPKQAQSEFITHLGTTSYTVDIGENVRLLALNDDQSGNGGAGFSDAHFQAVTRQIEAIEALAVTQTPDTDAAVKVAAHEQINAMEQANRDDLERARQEEEPDEELISYLESKFEDYAAYHESIENMEPSRWIILSEHGNTGFVQVLTCSETLKTIQINFALMFILIGALTILTTIGKRREV